MQKETTAFILFYKSSYLRENMDYFKAFSKRKWMTFILIYDSIDFVMCFDELVYSNLKKNTRVRFTQER